MDVTLTPAYGRSYGSKADVLRDWLAGQDFRIHATFPCGTYVSNRDVPALKAQGVTHIEFRNDRRLLAYVKL